MNCVYIREQDPLKQGLKQRVRWAAVLATTHIREQDPLKQGLKPFLSEKLKQSVTIREQDPLKQGLKLHLIQSTGTSLTLRFASKIH